MASGVPYTIVRPCVLNDESPAGRVELLEKEAGLHLSVEPGNRREIPRADVAAILRECIDQDAAVGKVFEAFSGPTPVADAVAALDRGPSAR